MTPKKSLVLGGVKSGKSRYAMQLADQISKHSPSTHSHGQAVFIATARADDDEMAQRIERHRIDRPNHWRVIEEPRHLTQCLQRLNAEEKHQTLPPVVLIDCLTLWLTQLCCEDLNEEELQVECHDLVDQIAELNYPIILVSNELNMGVTPLGEFSRRFCDTAGLLHQNLAQACDSVTLVVAGLPLSLKPSPN